MFNSPGHMRFAGKCCNCRGYKYENQCKLCISNKRYYDEDIVCNLSKTVVCSCINHIITRSMLRGIVNDNTNENFVCYSAIASSFLENCLFICGTLIPEDLYNKDFQKALILSTNELDLEKCQRLVTMQVIPYLCENKEFDLYNITPETFSSYVQCYPAPTTFDIAKRYILHRFVRLLDYEPLYYKTMNKVIECVYNFMILFHEETMMKYIPRDIAIIIWTMYYVFIDNDFPL